MKLVVIGQCASRPNPACWTAIERAAGNWAPKLDGTTLEARFTDNPDVLQFALIKPGMETETAQIDISWIASADQAERLEYLTTLALGDLERAILARRLQEPFSSLE